MRRLPLLLVAVLGCELGLGVPLGGGVVAARDLAGTYTGVLQGVTVASLGALDDPDRHVTVDVDLLHEVSIRATGDWTVRIESPVIPPLRAIVAGAGPVALNLDFVEFENLDLSDRRLTFGALKVKQIVFVQYEGEWIVVLQLIRVGVAADEQVDDVYVYQYVSYPKRLARRMSEDEAIRFVNAILRLASAATRS
jgi:hypothetical protein